MYVCVCIYIIVYYMYINLNIITRNKLKKNGLHHSISLATLIFLIKLDH